MTEERKQIIIKEIKYWKQNNLLPSQYCDFLLALYSQGEEQFNEESQSEWELRDTFYLIANLLLLLLTFLVIYFTEMMFLLQIVLFSIFTIASYKFYSFLKQKNNLNSVFSLIIFLLIVFLVSVYISTIISGSVWWLNVIVLINCTFWIIIGIYKKVTFLTLSGILGNVIAIILLVI